MAGIALRMAHLRVSKVLMANLGFQGMPDEG